MSLEILSQMRENKTNSLAFRNVTKIQFGTPFDRRYGKMRYLVIIKKKFLCQFSSYYTIEKEFREK